MLLSQWSCLPQEDQQTLSLGMDSAGQPLSSDMKLAIQFRLQKKRLLLQAVNAISKQIQVHGCLSRVIEVNLADTSSTKFSSQYLIEIAVS